MHVLNVSFSYFYNMRDSVHRKMKCMAVTQTNGFQCGNIHVCVTSEKHGNKYHTFGHFTQDLYPVNVVTNA